MAGLLRGGCNVVPGGVKGVSRVFAAPTIVNAEVGGVRNGAKLKEVKGRIRSVKNIGKITKTMKMIASARLREAQTRMERSRAFAEAPVPVLTLAKADPKKPIVIASIFTDRGLCGGLNSNVGRMLAASTKAREAEGAAVSFVGVGDKSTTALLPVANKVAISFGETSKRNLSFFAVSDMAEQILALKPEAVSVAYNKFQSVISMKPVMVDLPGYNTMMESGIYDNYNFEDDARIFHLQDMFDYGVASVLYGAYTENMASELGSRMTAMDNATRNAGEMLKKLEIWYNRGRQAAITTELTEIISGAAAIE